MTWFNGLILGIAMGTIYGGVITLRCRRIVSTMQEACDNYTQLIKGYRLREQELQARIAMLEQMSLPAE